MCKQIDLEFFWMDPIVGIARLLLNPHIRNAMIFSEADLTPLQRTAGHFLTGSIARQAASSIPPNPFRDGRPVLPLYLAWWSDSTNLCAGGTLIYTQSYWKILIIFFQ